jgi:ABC-type sugar transport system substrate-binding protein
MLGNGATKVALFGLPPGISTAFDARFAGAVKALDDKGLQVLAEARSFAMPESAQNLLTQFPDVDAIFSAVNASNYLLQPLVAGGYGGKMQLNSFDEDNDVSAGFDEGVVSHVVEGVNAQAQIAFVLLYNALTGNKMLNVDGSVPNILMPYVLLSDKASYQSYNELSKSGVYSFEQMSEYIALITPNASLSELIKLAESLGK